jgi:hypothetical protein
MEFSKQVLFKNWSGTQFTYKYNNEEHTFEAGATYEMPAGVALHFARHLAQRELFLSGDPKDEALLELKVSEYMSKCFPSTSIQEVESGVSTMKFKRIDIKDTKAEASPAVPENKTEKEVQNEKQEEEEDVKDNKPPKFKGGRPKKITIDAEYTK